MYSDHYGLTDRPFQLTPDPRFYFDSSTHRKAMTYLSYGLAQGEGFIVITGDVGTGKTTLVGHLMSTVDKARLNAVHLTSTQLEGDDILRITAQRLGLATEGVAKAQLLDRVERLLYEQARAGKRTLLIVDEAQNLPTSAIEELRMLSNFQHGGRALLQIFLLGQPEFRERLQKSDRLEQLRQRVIATHHLQPMSFEEIEPYVLHRLSLAGWNGNPHFTQEAFEKIFAWSGGVPRKVNTLGSRILLHGAVEQLSVIDGPAVATVIADIAEDDVDIETGTLDLTDAAAAAAAVIAKQQASLQPQIVPVQDPELLRRVERLEQQLEEQDVALRRVLTLLVDWVEGDEARPSSAAVRATAAA
jgi:general secretion pathway protein A